MTLPPDWTAPENDHRGIDRLPPAWSPTVAVVIPAYNRPEALDLTLAGLCAQLHAPDRVVVADDGSSVDLGPTVAAYTDLLPVSLERQERDGFGLARARNMGAAACDEDVLIFLDSDCIPGPAFVERHISWHARAANVLVAGSRVHVSVEGIDRESVRGGHTRLDDLPQVGEPVVEPGTEPADWRRPIYRRTAALTFGDQGFRAAVGCNISLTAVRFAEAGGFDPAFRAYGGEDTEFAWRVWQQGAFVVPDNSAVCFHQIQPGEDRTWRADSRRLSRPLLSDRIPNRFYRTARTPFATVPKLSWVVSVDSRDEADEAIRRLAADQYPDCELVLWGPSGAVAGLDALDGFASRVSVVDETGAAGLDRAVKASRGEVLALMDGRAEFSKALAEKAVRRLQDDPRASAVRFPYLLGGSDLYRRFDDLSDIDAAAGRAGSPLFAFVKRRELMKDREALESGGPAVAAAIARSRTLFMAGDRISLADASAPSAGRHMGVGEVLASDIRDLARVAVRTARTLREGSNRQPSVTTGSARRREDVPTVAPIAIDYIGFTEHNNLGDDAILVALQREMPWASLARDHADARVLMVGGGTLVNGARYYLNRVVRNDSPSMERLVMGVGVRDPDFHGVTEPIQDWARFFDSSLYAGVRGPDSIDALRKLGYNGEIDIFGDPAVLLEPPANVERNPDRVVVCPVWTSGNLMGGNDRAVFDALAAEIARLAAEGRDVVMLSAFPEDDRHLIALMRSAGLPDMPYMAGYESVDASMELLAGAGLVIAERLHAAILAAAAGTPFVGLEYWPKHRDFARSIDLERCIVPTAGLTAAGLATAVRAIDAARAEITETMDAAVAAMRTRQRGILETVRTQLTA